MSRASVSLLRRGLQISASMSPSFKVLFCSEHFRGGFLYTREALGKDEDVQVTSCSTSDVAEHIQDADVAVPLGTRLSREVLDGARNLKMIIQYGVGVEGVDIPAATEKKIWVSNIPSVGTGNSLSCAEMGIYLTLACLRNQKGMADSLQNRLVGWPIGETLFGKTVLLVGFGNISKELVPRLKAFGVRLLASRRQPWGRGTEAEKALEAQLDELGLSEDLPRLLSQADIVILTASLNDHTRGMVNSAFISHCKPGVHIVNVARGGLLDYDAVKAGLEAGTIESLGLDVQWQEPFNTEDYFAKHPRVILTPHVAGVTELSYRTMSGIVADEVRRIKSGMPPTVQLNSNGYSFHYQP